MAERDPDLEALVVGGLGGVRVTYMPRWLMRTPKE